MRNPADDRDEGPRGVGGRGAAGVAPRADALAERRWSIAAGVCLVAAAALWVFVGVDAAFVVATLGVLAWFWDHRNRVVRRSIGSGGRPGADDDEDEEVEDEFEDEDGGEINNDDEKPGEVGR
ncbi:MAG: hypothetical protein LC800_21725 [Acidobacteria bacterium]|nr:hypothetical protein [Acidobacteriota bacterium]